MPNIVAVQNLPLLYQRGKNKYEVLSLISNCATKIYLRNSDPETNEAASQLFGEMSNITVSPSETARFGEAFRRSHTSYSRGTSNSRVVPADQFAALAVPTADPGCNYAQSIVHVGTRPAPLRLDLLWKLHPL